MPTVESPKGFNFASGTAAANTVDCFFSIALTSCSRSLDAGISKTGASKLTMGSIAFASVTTKLDVFTCTR